ncbi:DUF4982 domain-containing protein [Mucilaginibacter sp. HMF5004]|uniref:DUF4982 domain-containing protein n=1 Tax=Mucilaginibacter rivuli TaxID=2857527 RepID=UPI001C5CEA9D|nr:DUF4982 domain-containing protein [Mucilaginibacter rivuli]MBW4888980.1 DUF4982 domain-containing protein [Mucilaginibacter rivuli]
MICLLCGLAAFGAGPRKKYNFNSSWKLLTGEATGADAPAFDDSGWKPVTLPHAFNEDDAFSKEIANLTTGIAWYRKHFKTPAGSDGKKIFIEFEGARMGAEVFLNGKSIGLSENGVMAFGFDLTDLLKHDGTENVIAVRVDNSWKYKEKSTGSGFEWNDHNFYANYGGLNKGVYLHITDKLYQTLPLYSNLKTTGTYIYARDIDIAGKSAVVNVETEVRNEYVDAKTFTYEVRVEDMDGKTVKTFSGGTITLKPGETRIIKANDKVNGLNFWSWGYGYLYKVYTSLKLNGSTIDEVKTVTGFRKTEFKNGMVYLNDRVIQMKGYAQRTTNEWPALGVSVPAWISDFSNGLMVEGNANLVRWMHVTPWKQDVESCDRVGLIQSMPAGDAEKDGTNRWWSQRLELMRDAMIYNRNSPSILFYESGNSGVSEDHMKDMKAIRDEYDPYGGRASGSRDMLESKTAEYGGEMLYIDKSATKPLWEMEFSRDEGLRTYWDEFSPPFHKEGVGPKHKESEDPASYNHNQDAMAREDVIRWYEYWHERPGTGDRVSSGGVNIIFSDSNTHFRGEENYRNSGEVDAMRIAKEGFFANQIMWDGWVDPDPKGLHIIGHWNYAKGVKKNVDVIAAGAKVQLFINGKSQGYGERSSHFLFTFKNISWEPGNIKAISYDESGNKLNESQLNTTGPATGIKLTVRTGPGGLKGDGADVALVDVEAVDAKGYRVPIAMDMIKFELSGPAEWRGGIAHGAPGNYILSKTLPLACGINRVIIRSVPKSGQIILKATAEGLKQASVTITSVPVNEHDGLVEYLPGTDLKTNLSKGPTPAGPSYKMSRLAAKIVKSTAGSNADDAPKTYDDNDKSLWKSDGTLPHAWIKYQLDKPYEISEITMKVLGWRTKKYPVKILVDNKEVYQGTTEQSLGYITIPVKKTKGQTVTIQLAGAEIEQDAFGLIEVNGKNHQSEGDSGKGKNAFGLAEVEIYQML